MSAKNRKVLLVVFGMICMAFMFIAIPQSMGADVDSAIDAGSSWSWKQSLQGGGWLINMIMVVLGVMSIVMITLVIYFVIILRPHQVAPATLRKEVQEKIAANEMDEVKRVCEYRSCPFSFIVLAAVNYLRGVPNPDGVLLKDIVEGEGGRQAEDILGQTQYLLDIAVISPMIGLLGTVFGMLTAFSAVALDIAKAKPMVMAAGVSQALVTTALGLMVGIPAMMFYAYFRRRAAKMVSYLESASADVLTSILGRDKV